MKTLRFPIASAIVTVCMLASPSLAHSPIPSFRSAEIHYRDESSIDKMRSALTAAIPPGIPVANAAAMLTHADARCRTAEGGDWLYQYKVYEPAEDVIHDVDWSLRLHASNGAVMLIDLDRSSAQA